MEDGLALNQSILSDPWAKCNGCAHSFRKFEIRPSCMRIVEVYDALIELPVEGDEMKGSTVPSGVMTVR